MYQKIRYAEKFINLVEEREKLLQSAKTSLKMKKQEMKVGKPSR